jgi:predicted outer membrane repeat protein
MEHGWYRLPVAGLGLVALAVALVLLTPGWQHSLAVGEIIYVDVGASGANNGASWDDAYTGLQDALDRAVATDQIWVAEGTYKPTWESNTGDPRSAAFRLKNGVALYGGFDPDAGTVAFEDRDWDENPTILSGDLDGDDGPGFANNAENSYHVFFHPEGTGLDGSAILDGFTISGGNADGAVPHTSGGGIYNDGASPALANCTFTGNSATHYGGGMYNYQSAPVLTNCTFSGNSAGRGGAVFNHSGSSPELINCTLSANSANYGGGLYNSSSAPELANCFIAANSAGVGGGIYNDSSAPALTGCTFYDNSATYGGGMENISSSPSLINCTFSGNSATYGGGMDNYDNSSPMLTNCTFSGNSASSGGGIYSESDSPPALTNCILWANGPDQLASGDPASTPVVTYSDIQGGWAGEGNIDADPLFANPGNGDFHLQYGSPCIDVGSNTEPDLPGYDFEGDARIIDGDGDGAPVVDMGADEARIRTYLPLLLRGY